MKRILLFFVVLLTLILSACGDAGKYVTADPSAYRVVRGDNSSSEVTKAAVGLRKDLIDLCKSDIAIATDYDAEVPLEILVGSTNREASVEAGEGLKYQDFVIKLNSEKIVIVGGSDEATENAVDYFMENFTDRKSGKIMIPEDGYSRIVETHFDSLKAFGVDLGEFIIKNNSLLDDDEIKGFAREIAALGAKKLPTSNGIGKNQIILDGTSLMADEYSVTIEDGSIKIRGSRDSLPAAMEEFLKNLGGRSERDCDLAPSDSFEGTTGKREIYSKEKLMTTLGKVASSDKIMIGEEIQGEGAGIISEMIKYFADSAGGHEPAIIGIDLACYGIKLMDVDEKTKSGYVCDLVDYASRGGVITASSHFDNPGDPAKAVRGKIIGDKTGTLSDYEAAFEELLTEGSELNKFWKAELIEDARFLKALGNNGVPVIWRPLHESNGSWFWFCTTQDGATLDSSYLRRMWIYIYDLYTKELGLDNLIWCYGPNTSSNIEDKPGGLMSPWYCYPGDEYVDMVGVDWYTGGNYEISANDNYNKLLEKTGKIGAITEFGPSGSLLAKDGQNQEELFDCDDLRKLLEKLRGDGYEITYLITWGSIWGAPAMGNGEKLMESEIALGLDGMERLLSD